jgi:pimeloyl-ACP methyl ester carboxylesterase
MSILLASSKSDDFSGDETLEPQNGYEYDHARADGLDQDRYITMKSTGLKVHYRVIGKGPIDIVFIPGWTNPLTVFTKQFDYFRDKARCIYIDLPGHGLSDAPKDIEYTMGIMADAIYEVIKKERVNKFVAVGFSIGAVPLGQFELKHPGMITKLVNLDGGFTIWPPEVPERDTFMTWRDNYYKDMLTWDRATKEFLLGILIPPTAPDDLKELGQYFLDYPNWLMANIWYNGSAEEVNQPIGWTMPIMSIYSAEPTDMDYEQLFFPNADIKVMTGSGHVIQWERADTINAIINDFISARPVKKY